MTHSVPQDSKQICHIITGLENGGAEGVLFRLCSSDKTKKHYVISLTGLGKYGKRLKELGVQVECLNISKSGIPIAGFFKLWSLLRKNRPEVVQTWMYHADFLGTIAAKLAGVKRIFWNIRHTQLIKGMSSTRTILIAKLCAKISWIPVKIVCCANAAADIHAELGYDSSKFVVIPNGYDLEKFKPNIVLREKTREELGFNEDTLALGMVGRFNPQKNHLGLIKSLKTLKESKFDYKCLLVGEGIHSKNSSLMAMIHQHKLSKNIILLGPRDDIPSIMNALDIHLLTSTYGEGFPNVLAEAMACGTPCVATDVGDTKHIIGSTGWTVDANSQTVFETALLEACMEWKNKLMWSERRKTTRFRIANNFKLSDMTERYFSLWGVSDN